MRKPISEKKERINGAVVTVRVYAPSGRAYRDRPFADPVLERERMTDIHLSALYEFNYGVERD